MTSQITLCKVDANSNGDNTWVHGAWCMVYQTVVVYNIAGNMYTCSYPSLLPNMEMTIIL